MIRIEDAEFLISAMASRQFPVTGKPEFTFVGRSNCGKSSILNMLCGSDIARVSKTPGRTQAVNFFGCEKVMLADLPGYGFAKVPLKLKKSWSDLLEGYLRDRENLRMIFWIFDIRRVPDETDLNFLAWLEHYNRSCVLVINKIDKEPKNTLLKSVTEITRNLPGLPHILASAVKGTGRKELLQIISENI